MLSSTSTSFSLYKKCCSERVTPQPSSATHLSSRLTSEKFCILSVVYQDFLHNGMRSTFDVYFPVALLSDFSRLRYFFFITGGIMPRSELSYTLAIIFVLIRNFKTISSETPAR